MTRKGKNIPRLPLSAFNSTSQSSLDTFPIPPTPSFVSPRGIVDAHLHDPDINQTSVVKGHRPANVDTLAVLVPFVLAATQPSKVISPALSTTYDAATLVVAEVEGTKDQSNVEVPVENLRWALQHAKVVDLNIEQGILAIDTPVYDSLLNLLSKATCTNGAPIVLTNVLPPPLPSVMPVVTMMNHPTYNTYRQRISSLSLFGNVSVKLLPPTWVSTESIDQSGEKQQRELRNLLKLFIVPVLEAFGFERILFGSSPALAGSSSALSEVWYRLVLESFRELAVSQDEMDKIFIDNAERVYQ